MTKQEAKDRLKALEAERAELQKIVEAKESPKELFWRLIGQTTSIKTDLEKCPNSTFGFAGDKFLWEYNSKNQSLWLSYPLIWSVFEREYSIQYSDIQSAIKIVVEEHFKCNGVTPSAALYVDWVEEHFKK